MATTDPSSSVASIAQPCLPLAPADYKAVVRFTQTQPPAALRIAGIAAEQPDQKRRELLNRARERGGEQGAQYKVALHMSIECRRQRTASGTAPDCTIKVRGPSAHLFGQLCEKLFALLQALLPLFRTQAL